MHRHRIPEHRFRSGDQICVPGPGSHRYRQYVVCDLRGCWRDDPCDLKCHPGVKSEKSVMTERKRKSREMWLAFFAGQLKVINQISATTLQGNPVISA